SAPPPVLAGQRHLLRVRRRPARGDGVRRTRRRSGAEQGQQADGGRSMRVSRPGRIRSRVAVAAVAALALLGTAGCASDDSAARAAADGNADTNFVGGSGAVTIIKPGKREKLPRLAGPTLD